MKTLLILSMLIPLAAQTRVRPEQIVRDEQVRIYQGDDTPPGTRILATQISDGRQLIPPDQWQLMLPNYGAQILPICVLDWYGLGLPPDYTTKVYRALSCYTVASLPFLKQDPSWSAWLGAHGF